MDPVKPLSSVAVIGGGPAGLTAAYILAKAGVPVTVFEADARYVGGIARTEVYKGFRFDIGGHRFFSKSKEVEDLWTEVLGADMLERPRSSRIFYRGKYFTYPLRAFEALVKLGPIEALLCVLSYARSRLFPIRDAKSFQDWVTNQFGARLFGIFFKTYTEKVWGMSCREISADWAAQRIKGLSLGQAILHACKASFRSFMKPGVNTGDRSKMIKTLIDSFRYPRLGPGMMWEKFASEITRRGGTIVMGARVVGAQYDSSAKQWTVTCERHGERERTQERISAAYVLSSAPLRELALSLSPEPDAQTIAAANELRYRDFLIVALVLKSKEHFTDNWVYIHDPSVKVGRIQNFKSWSPEMVPSSEFSCYGLEYFCFEGDGLWNSSDEDLLTLAKRELEAIGIAKASDVLDGCVVRQKKAYPVYDDSYASAVEVIRKSLEKSYPGMIPIGRNGMHKYNNQDHAMMTGILAARNIIAGRSIFDLWAVNQDAEYHEAGTAGDSGGRLVPRRFDSAREYNSLPGHSQAHSSVENDVQKSD